ncbi:hypothetical protein evm_015468 [Chilo suppressalis]|nr:hypothetical protein evm_015468 [Chilo suppressalis]
MLGPEYLRMARPLPNEQFSDDEIFFGKLSLREVRKHILWSDHKPNIQKRNSDNEDIRIIETHSEPDLNRKDHNNLAKKAISNTSLSPDTQPYANWNIKPADDSFLKVEKMVTNLCVPDESERVTQLNNTLDIIDYILSKGPQPSEKKKDLYEVVKKETAVTKEENLNSLAKEDQKPNLKSSAYCTPVSDIKKPMDSCVTPFTDLKQKVLFKTPKNPLSQKKPSATSLKKTPSRSNVYQHIASPVASYIKKCPVTPLVKDVRPMKPLPGMSSIPKFVKIPPPSKSSSKENINLPPVAYKSAKTTRVVSNI